MKRLSLVLMALLMATWGVLSACSGGEEKATPTNRPFQEETVTQQVSKDTSTTVALDDGLEIDLPAGSIIDDHDTLTVTSSQESPPVDQGSLGFMGTFYDMDLENGDFFNGAVRVDLPYDETRLPPDRTEAEVFAVFSADGEWHRIYGDVDTDRNILTVYTTHNGFWSTAIDRVSSFVGDVADFFSGRQPDYSDLEKARENVEQRRDEFIVAGQQAISCMYDLEDYQPWEFATKQIGDIIIIEGSQKAMTALGAKTLVAGKMVVAAKLSLFIAVIGIGVEAHRLYIFAEELGGCIAERVQAEIAFDRLQEAEAILWVLEHPEVQTIPTDYQEALQDYLAAMPIDQTISIDTPIDFDLTAYPNATPEPTPAPTPAPTPEPTPTPTPEPIDNPPVILGHNIPDRIPAYGVFDISVEVEDDNGVDRVHVEIDVDGAVEDIALRETSEGVWTASHKLTSTGTFPFSITATDTGGQESDPVAGEIVSYAVGGGGGGGQGGDI